MQSYHLNAAGDPEGITLRESPDPVPGPGEILVRIHARSLNFRDGLILRGQYPVPAQAGVVPLSDGAGEVVSLGASVSRVAVGDRVSAAYFPRWAEGPLSMAFVMEQFGCTRDGMLADLVVMPDQAAVKIPPQLSYEEASTLPCAGVTAWNALFGGQRILPGQTVLTLGSGGVATFAVQFAKILGARVIAVTSTDEKAELLRGLGAQDVINRTATPDWGRVVQDLTGGGGVEHVVESGSLETLPRSIAAAAPGAEIALVAALGAGSLDPRVLGAPVTIRRFYVGSRAHFEAMNRAIEIHEIRPVIDQCFSFANAPAAYAHFLAKHHTGKVVIGR
ncbi:NAD(P)-dependent alcohol dehydrogenase [Bradyrhizobium sp. 156]|uniref:zinc-dependent alcohol dehydrogenase family protein n=1 Tax=Bradyrhizobium sp. 156 TaxID=2782630 RepID=UPI001FF83271|nr:NAD(P)-dependent alcohol dehydrogenase [Bradyrhizobium sp. 156]MCK1323595.1 NAD(P)-dependent alcohol dehydrogenase [Bradyrhizobium sp. 156]